MKLKVLPLLLTSTVLTALGQFTWKIGAPSLSLSTIFSNPYLWFGFIFYGVATVLLIMSLKSTQLSHAYPILSAGFIWVTILAVAILGESFSGLKLLGLFCIIGGISLISKDMNNK